MGLVSGWSLANHSNSESFLVAHGIAQPRWMLARGIVESGQTCGVSFRPFPDSSGWWWLTSSVFLIRTSCHKTTHANGYYGAWPGWAASISVLPLTLAVQGTLTSLLQHHSSKASILWHSAFFIVQFSHPYMTTGKTIALTRWTFVGEVVSLLFNMLYRLLIAFLPKSKHLLISWLQSLSSVILEPKKIVFDCSHWFPIYMPWSELKWFFLEMLGWRNPLSVFLQLLLITV